MSATPPTLKYKGFEGTFRFNSKENMYSGVVVLNDSIAIYKSDSVRGLERCFHEAIHDYLDMQERLLRYEVSRRNI